MNLAQLRESRYRLELPISDRQIEAAPYYHPGPDSLEVQYMMDRRAALGGSLPKRVVRSKPLRLPSADLYEEFKAGTGTGREVSTTMAFVRLLRQLMRDERIGRRIVPIIPDEARTFGMDSLFREVGIYSSVGQLYESVDAQLLLSYHESKEGQILEEGITEAGSSASFMASGTSYATVGEITIPFYIFCSMFGFQRTGDKLAGSPTVTVWGTGTPRREFMYSEDMADACVFLMGLEDDKFVPLLGQDRNDGLPPLVNIGVGEDLTIAELAGLVKKVTGYAGEIVFDTAKPDGTPRKLMDVSRLRALGWQPLMDLEPGLRSAYAWFVEHAV